MTNTATAKTTAHPMLPQGRIDSAEALGLRFTGGERPIGGDETATHFGLWKEFRTPSVWSNFTRTRRTR